MSSHLIDTSEEEDCVVALALYVSDLLDEGKSRTALADTAGSAFNQQCRELLEQGDFEGVLDKIIEQFPLLFTKGAAGDVEAALAVSNHLLLTGLPSEQQPAYLQKVAAGLTVKDAGNSEPRLSALTELFNSTKESKLQYELLLQAIAFAKGTSQSTILAPGIRSHIDTWVKEWNLSPSEQQKLFLAIADLFRANKKRKALIKEAYKLTVRALASMQDLSDSELGDIKAITVSAVSEFIGSGDVFHFDLHTSPAVKQLEKDEQYAPVYQLLTLLLNGDVQGLDSFLKEHSSTVESIGSNDLDLRAKARLMALLSLSATQRRIDYSTIQERLGLADTEEVEDWLVRAMGKKLLSGQMDQVKQQVTITRASQQTFDSEDWQLLQKQLVAWKTNVESVRELVKSGDSSLKSLQGGLNGHKPVDNGRAPLPRAQTSGVHA